MFILFFIFFFFKQKTAYEGRISDWSSDVCSSDLASLTRSGDSRIKPLAGKHPLVTQVDNHKHQGGFPALHLMTGHNVSQLNRSNLGLTCECHVKGAFAIPEFDRDDMTRGASISLLFEIGRAHV